MPGRAQALLPRVYPILDTATAARLGLELVAAAAALLEGGAAVLQFRHKGHWSRATFDTAREIARLCGEAGARFVVNDRADFALLLQAGLHVGQEDLPPRDARRVLGSGLPIGFSSHNAGQLSAADAEPVDYLALGPIFRTGSKSHPDPVVGVEELRRLRPLTGKPLVAIGGITLENARDVWTAGADSAAVIGGLFCEQPSLHSLRLRMEEWRALGAGV